MSVPKCDDCIYNNDNITFVSFLEKCMHCKRAYKVDTEPYENFPDLYKKEEE